MPALTARETARYGARLFSYMLTSTLVGGGLIVGGAVLAYVLEPAVLPGGRAPQAYAPVAAGAGLVLLGVLVLLTGAVLVVFTVASDALRVGTRRREAAPDEPEPAGAADDESQAVPSVDTGTDEPSASPAEPARAESVDAEPTVSDSDSEPAAAESEQEATVAESEGDGSDSASQEPATDGEGRDPFASAAESGRHDEPIDATDPIDEPHSASTNPFGEPEPEETTAEEWRSKAAEADDDAWREEIEAKLDGDEEEA